MCKNTVKKKKKYIFNMKKLEDNSGNLQNLHWNNLNVVYLFHFGGSVWV